MQEKEQIGGLQLKRRWDIYLNGKHGLKELVIAMLLTWRGVPWATLELLSAMRLLLVTIGGLLLLLLCPLLFWMAPVIAPFTAHWTPSDEEIRARMRANIHKNGGAA